MRDIRADGVHLRAGLLQAHAGLELAHRAEPVEVAGHVGGLERQRLPDLGEGAVEHGAAGHDAGHLIGFVIEADGLADDGWVPAELALPEGMTQHYDFVFAELVFVGAEGAAERGANAQNVEVVGRDAHATQQGWLAGAGQGRGPAALGRHVFENLVLLDPVQIVEGGDAVGAAVGPLLQHAHDALGIGVGERVEQDRVDEAEDGRIGADAEGEGEKGDKSEAGALEQSAGGVTQVLQELGHDAPSSLIRARAGMVNHSMLSRRATASGAVYAGNL